MVWNINVIKPIAGDLICSKFSYINVWNEDLDCVADELGTGELMIVLAVFNSRRLKRLSPENYRKVLTANQKVGWVNLDNCELIRRYSYVQ